MSYEGEANEVELMRQQLTDHQRVIENHGERLNQIEEDFAKMRDDQDDFHSKIELIEKNQLELKNVIYSENRETRETMRGTTERLFHLIEQMTGNKQASTALEYDFKKTSLEVSDKKSQRLWEWFGKAAGAGGVIALVVAALLQLLGQ